MSQNVAYRRDILYPVKQRSRPVGRLFSCPEGGCDGRQVLDAEIRDPCLPEMGDGHEPRHADGAWVRPRVHRGRSPLRRRIEHRPGNCMVLRKPRESHGRKDRKVSDPRCTRRWRVLRESLFLRDKKANAKCWICGQAIDYRAAAGTPDSWEPDHVVPVTSRPDLAFDPGNIKPAHCSCNRSRGNCRGDSSLGTPSRVW